MYSKRYSTIIDIEETVELLKKAENLLDGITK